MGNMILFHKETTGNGERRKTMKMKPKSTVKNPKALVYRRFIGLEKSVNLGTVYFTTVDSKSWTFDVETLTFQPFDSSLIITSTNIVDIATNTTILTYLDKYFAYVSISIPDSSPTYAWMEPQSIGDDVTLLSAKFNNIGKYQTNKYYYVGSFDYMVKGSIEGTTSQYIKGNIIPLTSMNIKHFNDEINLNVDDLVVIGKKLFSVENPETTMKMQPKPLKIYFATLNAIL